MVEGFGVSRMVNHFVNVFHPPRHPPPPRHRLGHLLDARLTDRTAESIHLQLGLRMRLCHVAIFNGYQQSQQRITTKVGGERNDQTSLASCLSAAFRAARFARIADRFGDSTLFHHPVKVKFETSRYSMTMVRFELQKSNKNNIRDVRCKISIKRKYMRSSWTVLNRTRYKVFNNKRSLPSGSPNGTACKQGETNNQKGV